MNTDCQFQRVVLVTIMALLATGLANAARAVLFNEARVTRVKGLVQLLHPMAAARQASVNDVVGQAAAATHPPANPSPEAARSPH